MGSILGVERFLRALALDSVGGSGFISRKHHNIFYISLNG